MTKFKVFSAGCDRCKSSAETLRSVIAERRCGCVVEEIACDGNCSTAKQHGFAGKERPVIMRDDEVVHQGLLATDQAIRLLPA